MVGMDSQIKGIILNLALKWYTITPIESADVLKVTMKFYEVTSTKAPAKGGGTSSGRRSSRPSSGEILTWCQFLSLNLSSLLHLSPSVHQLTPPSPLSSLCRKRRQWMNHQHDHLARRQKKLKGKEVLGYWTWKTRSQMWKVKYGSWGKTSKERKKSWHSLKPEKKGVRGFWPK